MSEQSVAVANEAMEKFSVEKDIAQHIKREFDSRYGATWHCIVGRNFGSFVTHGMSQRKGMIGDPANVQAETKHFIYFYLGNCAILLFKTQ